MGRRTSSGRVGAPSIGGILAENQTITTDEDADIIINPTGTGRLLIDAHTQVQNQSSVRFGDADDSNYVALQAPNAVASDTTWKLPGSDGANGQVLQTNGTGDLTFVDAGVTVSTDNSDSNIVYPILSSVTDGTATSFEVATSKLSFQASTGTVFAPVMTGGTGSGDDLCLNSTTNGTKGQVVVSENTASSSTTTGAFRVVGGMGVGEDIYVGGTVRSSGDVFACDNGTGLQAQIGAKLDASDSPGEILYLCAGCWNGRACIPSSKRGMFHRYEITGHTCYHVYYCSQMAIRAAGACGGSCSDNVNATYCCAHCTCGWVGTNKCFYSSSRYDCAGALPWPLGCNSGCRTACSRRGFQWTMAWVPENVCCGSDRGFYYCIATSANGGNSWCCIGIRNSGQGYMCCGAHPGCIQCICMTTPSGSIPFGCVTGVQIRGIGRVT